MFTFPAFGQSGLSVDSMHVCVRCPIAGLKVLIDEDVMGVTPLEDLMLLPGSYRVVVRHPRPQDWLAQDWKRIIVGKSGESLSVDVQFKERTWIGSDPQGSAVIDGEVELGHTPLLASIDPDASHAFKFHFPGRFGKPLTVRSPTPAVIHAALPMVPGTKEETKPRLRRGWIIGSAVLGVVSGIAGYYLRRQADRSYEKYRDAVRPDVMDRYFNDAKTYDRWSGWCYGVGEASLVVSLTMFIGRFSG